MLGLLHKPDLSKLDAMKDEGKVTYQLNDIHQTMPERRFAWTQKEDLLLIKLRALKVSYRDCTDYFKGKGPKGIQNRVTTNLWIQQAIKQERRKILEAQVGTSDPWRM